MSLNALQEQIEKIRTDIEEHRDILTGNEAQTKSSLIEPVLRSLGWDDSDLTRVRKEYGTEVGGLKSGEKVDYALIKDGKPVILVEAKHLNSALNDTSRKRQLFRYLRETSASVGILSNGRHYDFYVDKNVVDLQQENPLFSVDIAKASTSDMDLLLAFSWERYDYEAAVKQLEDAHYRKAIRETLFREFQNPQDAFVRWIMDETYEGRKTSAEVYRFAGLVKDALGDFPITVGGNDSGQSEENDKLLEEPMTSQLESGNKGIWTPLTDLKIVTGVKARLTIRLPNGKERSVKNWRRLFIEVAEWLACDGVLNPGICPVVASHKGSYYAGSQPFHGNGKKFLSPHKLVNGVFVAAHGSASDMVNRSIRLMRRVGQDPSQVWVRIG